MPYVEIGLADVLHVKTTRDHEGTRGRTIHLFTNNGRALVPEEATDFSNLLELLQGIAKQTPSLSLQKRPWVKELILWTFVSCAAFVIIAILVAVL